MQSQDFNILLHYIKLDHKYEKNFIRKKVIKHYLNEK